MDQFLAEIRLFPFTFPPQQWAFCEGQLLPISQNTALFSLLGTTYGGNGRSNFALPDMRGVVPVHVGFDQPGPGLSEYTLGQLGGANAVTLLESEIPGHTHQLRANVVDAADVSVISESVSALAPSTGGAAYQPSANSNLGFQAVAPAGSDSAHNNMQPYLKMRYCIALQGQWPTRP
jgi:microcystin-dependent protein